jgi:Zn finger protein HypA/HybF involved in hydrogenase expression
MTTSLSKFEEPAKCLDCGLECEATDLNRSSLDAYADLTEDYDLLCPRCHNNNIRLYKPKEDRQ